jgi:hypothetical protein
MNRVDGRELGLRRAFCVAKHTLAQIFSEISMFELLEEHENFLK